MDLSRSASILFLICASTPMNAQVANDDCANAEWKEFSILAGFCPLVDNGGQFIQYANSLVDSTDMAQMNFPYPTNPNTCWGYSNTIQAPASDMWYVFHVPGGTNVHPIFNMFASDTCHVSWWQGSCGTLFPLDCWTILPNDTTYFTTGFQPSNAIQDTLLLQVSNGGFNTDVRFDICYAFYTYGIVPINYLTYAPTPYTCVTYSSNVVPASAINSADGSVSIIVEQGIPPHSIVWNTGDTTFSVYGLDPGQYSFSITDSIGCLQVDSISVPIDQTTLVSSRSQPKPCSILRSANGIEFNSIDECELRVFDLFGRQVYQDWMSENEQVLLPRFGNGLYLVTSTRPDGNRCVSKVIMP